MRDRDIRKALRDLLIATNAFDYLPMGLSPAEYGIGDIGSNTVQIDPSIEQFEALWDGSGLDGGVMHGRMECTFTCRNEEPEVRDEHLERLYNIACNAANHTALPTSGSATLPAFTLFEQLRWQVPVHPERQAKAWFTYRYLISSSKSMDATE